jgi:hypothetical protein
MDYIHDEIIVNLMKQLNQHCNSHDYFYNALIIKCT